MLRPGLLATVLLTLLASSALAQSRYVDKKRHFSFPIPSGWQEVSKTILAEEYEKMDEGIDGLAITLTAFESNPRQRRTHPTLVVRYNRMKPAEMTKMYERLKADPEAVDKILAAMQFPAVYKIGKVAFDERKATVRIPHSYESWNENPIRLILIQMLGQYCLVTLEFRGEKDLFKKHGKAIEATIAGFEFDRRFRLGEKEEEEEAPPPPPPPPPRRPSPVEVPVAEPESGLTSGTVLAIMGVLIVIGILALIVVKAGAGRQPARRRRGGPPPRRRR